MIVVCAIDRYFVELAGVMLASFEANAGLPEAEILIVGDGLRQKDRRALQACVERPLRFIDLPADIEAAIATLPTTARWSRISYARLFLPDRLFGRLLYLDADLLILRDLKWTETVDMAGAALAACAEPNPAARNQALARPAETAYFNSGVLLIDSAAWRDAGLGRIVADIVASGRLAFPDQDALNLASGGHFLHLDPMWNVQSRAESFAEAGILHFTHAKPNRADCQHPMRHLFLHYRQRTPWAGKPLRSYFLHRWHRVRHSAVKRVVTAWRSLVAPGKKAPR